MKTFTIRKLEPSDYEGWAILFSGYAEYYKFNIEDANIKQTWKWINDFDHPLECLAAFEDHQIIGPFARAVQNSVFRLRLVHHLLGNIGNVVQRQLSPIQRRSGCHLNALVGRHVDMTVGDLMLTFMKITARSNENVWIAERAGKTL